MYKTVKTQTRPNLNVPFFDVGNSTEIAESTKLYYVDTYINTGKVISQNATVSEDGLVKSNTMIWRSQEDFDAFRNDEQIQTGMMSITAAYNTTNGITSELTISEEI